MRGAAIIAGDNDLTFDSYDTDSCRTDYFDYVTLVGFSPASKKLAFRLIAGVDVGNLPLSPGYGPILNLHFTVGGGTGPSTSCTPG